MNKYRIKLNGAIYEMEVELISSASSSSALSTSKPDESEGNNVSMVDKRVEDKLSLVVSPMPGNVVEIMARPGETIGQNDAVIIIESMKMENEICAPKAGIVKNIFVSKGQVVSSNDPLFEMED